jgi:hypothetical protein
MRPTGVRKHCRQGEIDARPHAPAVASSSAEDESERRRPPFGLFRRRHMNVHGLDSDSSRTGETVAHDLGGAGEQAG